MINQKNLDDAIRSWAETKARLAEMEAELKAMKKEAGDVESYITQAMSTLNQEIRRVDNITVKVKKRQEGGRAKYKDSFVFLYNKVNGQLREMADDFLESTKGDKWVRTFLQVESTQLSEGIMKRVYSAIKGFVSSVLNRLRGISSDIDELEGMERAQTESYYRAKADFLLDIAG